MRQIFTLFALGRLCQTNEVAGGEMKAVDFYQLSPDLWFARIFTQTFSGTKAECEAWLRANGVEVK